jgi:hypothetical protein
MQKSRKLRRAALGVICIIGVAVAVALPAGDADAFSEPIPTKISLLKWGGNPKVGKLYKIVSKTPNPPMFTLPAAPPDSPVEHGVATSRKRARGASKATRMMVLQREDRDAPTRRS